MVPLPLTVCRPLPTVLSVSRLPFTLPFLFLTAPRISPYSLLPCAVLLFVIHPSLATLSCVTLAGVCGLPM